MSGDSFAKYDGRPDFGTGVTYEQCEKSTFALFSSLFDHLRLSKEFEASAQFARQPLRNENWRLFDFFGRQQILRHLIWRENGRRMIGAC